MDPGSIKKNGPHSPSPFPLLILATLIAALFLVNSRLGQAPSEEWNTGKSTAILEAEALARQSSLNESQ